MNVMTKFVWSRIGCSHAKNSLRHSQQVTTPNPSTTPQIRVPRVFDPNRGPKGGSCAEPAIPALLALSRKSVATFRLYPQLQTDTISYCRAHSCTMNPEDTYRSVQQRYANVANQADSKDQEDYEQRVATAFGYDPEELLSIPGNANLGVSCGNPLAMANISPVRYRNLLLSALTAFLTFLCSARQWLIWAVVEVSMFYLPQRKSDRKERLLGLT